MILPTDQLSLVQWVLTNDHATRLRCFGPKGNKNRRWGVPSMKIIEKHMETYYGKCCKMWEWLKVHIWWQEKMGIDLQVSSENQAIESAPYCFMSDKTGTQGLTARGILSTCFTFDSNHSQWIPNVKIVGIDGCPWPQQWYLEGNLIPLCAVFYIVILE